MSVKVLDLSSVPVISAVKFMEAGAINNSPVKRNILIIPKFV